MTEFKTQWEQRQAEIEAYAKHFAEGFTNNKDDQYWVLTVFELGAQWADVNPAPWRKTITA